MSEQQHSVGSLREALLATLASLGLGTRDAYEKQAFSRNIGLLSEADQQRLARAKIAIPGMGGVGGAHLATAARVGFGAFHLADFDVFEPANINRQYGAKVPNFGKSKLDVMMEEALSINPHIDLTPFPHGIRPDCLDAFLDGVDVVIDGLDFFVFETRRALFKRARELGIPVITAGPLGFSTVWLVFDGRRGMTFDEYFGIHDGLSEREKLLYFAAGLAPSPTHWRYGDPKSVDWDKKVGPSSAIACMLCAGVAVMEAARIVLDRPGLQPVPHYAQFDPYVRKFRTGKLRGGNRNPIQRAKIAIFLKTVGRWHKDGT